ncbi:MAG: tRNA pseudouridine(55) synthase TruB [Candidatus Hydrogenedens sp.]
MLRKDGIILINKPSGLTSHDVVDYIRKKTGIKRIGHTGTLDPNATGLLILCLGKATKLSEYFVDLDKTYEGKMRLGLVSDSHDIDGNIKEKNTWEDISENKIKKYISQFVGELEQIPPMVSAIKVGGKRLYKMAREGLTVEREARKVIVYEFLVLKIELPDIWFRVSCSRGTYVRTLCHDFGQKIGCGAILTELKRTKIGNYSVENAIPLETLETKEEIQKQLINIEQSLDLPRVILSSFGENLFVHGNKVQSDEILEMKDGTKELVQVFNKQGIFLGVASVTRTAVGPSLIPKKVFI